jgi:hypothetical protein
MTVFKTSQGRWVKHCHLGQQYCESTEHSPAKKQEIRDWIRRHHPDAVETNEPSNKYNCIGFALARSHGWFLDYEMFFTDDCFTTSFASPAVGDVVRYDRDGVFMHVAKVSSVTGNKITRVRSKWANGPELSHDLLDLISDFGLPVGLLRPRSGVIPFIGSIIDEVPQYEGFIHGEDLSFSEIIVDVRVGPLDDVQGGDAMSEKSINEAIQESLARLLDPDVYIKVNFASTPEAARKIIERLPGVSELIEIGPDSTDAVLNLLESAKSEHNRELSSIALYLLQRIPTAEATKRIANGISQREFTGLNMYLAADALLTSANVETVNEEILSAALREAENLK